MEKKLKLNLNESPRLPTINTKPVASGISKWVSIGVKFCIFVFVGWFVVTMGRVYMYEWRVQEIVRSSTDAAEALAEIRRLRFDLSLLDFKQYF